MPHFLTPRQIEERFQVNKATLRKYLRKFREEHPDDGTWRPVQGQQRILEYKPSAIKLTVKLLRKFRERGYPIMDAALQRSKELRKKYEVIEEDDDHWFCWTKARRYLDCEQTIFRRWTKKTCPYDNGAKLETRPFERDGKKLGNYYRKSQLDRVISNRAAMPKASALEDRKTTKELATSLGASTQTVLRHAPLPKKQMLRTADGRPKRQYLFDQEAEDSARKKLNPPLPPGRITLREGAKRLGLDRSSLMLFNKKASPWLGGRKLTVFRGPAKSKGGVQEQMQVLETEIEDIRNARSQGFVVVTSEGAWRTIPAMAKLFSTTDSKLRFAFQAERIKGKKFPTQSKLPGHDQVLLLLEPSVRKFLGLPPELAAAAPTPNGSPAMIPCDRQPGRRGRRPNKKTQEVHKACYEGIEMGKTEKNLVTEMQRRFPEPEYSPPKKVQDVSTYAGRYAEKNGLPWPIDRMEE